MTSHFSTNHDFICPILVLLSRVEYAVTLSEQSVHRVIILNRGSMFACQWREFSLLLSSAHRLLQWYHSQWEIGDAAIPGEFLLSLCHYRAISQWASILEWRHAVTLHILVGEICISFFLFYCEGLLSLVVLWLCEPVCNQRSNEKHVVIFCYDLRSLTLTVAAISPNLCNVVPIVLLILLRQLYS